MNTTETTQGHEHAFPVQPPEGLFWAPGPCRICGKTYERAQAERALREAQAAMETLDACPVEARFDDGRDPCMLPGGHEGPHSFGDTLLPYDDEEPAP